MTTHQLGGMLLQYARASRQQLFPNIAADFRAVANTVSQEELRRALASTLQAEPAEVVAELFRLSDLHQRVAVIQILTSLMEGGSLGLLANAGVLGFPPSPRTVAPQVAMQLAPDAVARLVTDAAAQDSSLIDRIAAFYAQNPKVIARLPASALVHIMHDLASGTLGNASGRP